MFRIPALSFLALLPTLLAVPGCGEKELDYGPGHAVFRLISESMVLVPGTTTTLGVTFDIEPGWHLYWNGRNDTGYPIQVSLELPDAFITGEILWPAPARHVSPGQILDHIYTDRVTLLVPLRVPDHASPGSAIGLRCAAEWLACREACVPGKGVSGLELRVAGSGEAPRNASDPGMVERLTEARNRLPAVLGSGDSRLRWRWEEDTLVLEMRGAQRLAFYPHTGCAELDNLLRDGEAHSSELRLELAEPADRTKSITGVLAAGYDGAETRFFSITLPLPES